MEEENTVKGTRPAYTSEQKQEVVDFINNYNKQNGRGGQSQAVKEFKISAVTINNWLKKSRSNSPIRRAKKEGAPQRRKPTIDPVEGYRRLADIHEKIKELEEKVQELAQLKQDAEELYIQLGI